MFYRGFDNCMRKQGRKIARFYEPLTVGVTVGGTVANLSARDRRHGAQERHRARRRIGTGANPSERRERHGGRLWRVWREPVGRLSEPNHGEPEPVGIIRARANG